MISEICRASISLGSIGIRKCARFVQRQLSNEQLHTRKNHRVVLGVGSRKQWIKRKRRKRQFRFVLQHASEGFSALLSAALSTEFGVVHGK